MTNDKLPQGWVECQLGQVFETSSGGTPKRGNPKYYQNGTIPWLKSGELNNSIIYNAEEFITEEALNNSSAKIFPKGSLLIALYGATVGKLGILDFASATNQAVCCIYQNVNYNKNFLFYYLLLKKEYLVNQGKGGAQPNISQEIIKALLIPFPPLNEQRRIVEKIESEFKKIDKGLEYLEQAKELIKQYRQSVLKSAFNSCSKGNYIKIGELCEVVRGGSPRPAGDERYYNGNIPFLKVADITKDNNKYLTKYTYTIKEAGLKKTRFVKANVLLLSNSGATLGVPKICTFATTFNDGIAAFLGLTDEVLDYHYYYWLSKTKELRGINQGAAQPNLNTDIIKEQLIPNIDKFEQKKIVEEIETRFALADKVEKVVDDNIKQAKQLKQSILKKAFEGRLVPQDPTDEPASVLLEKIKKEKNNDRK